MVKRSSGGEAACCWVAGREKKGAPIDLGVGILVYHKVGAAVQRGDVLFTIMPMMPRG
jgi:thymidine phosphorylase